MVHTLRLWVLFRFLKKPVLPYVALKIWFYITEAESVYCAVRSEYLSKADTEIIFM